MWGEVAGPGGLLARVWPRAAAYGGRLWAYTNVLSQQATALAVAAHTDRLLARGVPSQNVMLPYCRRYPDMCFSDAQRKPGVNKVPVQKQTASCTRAEELTASGYTCTCSPPSPLIPLTDATADTLSAAEDASGTGAGWEDDSFQHLTTKTNALERVEVE